MNDLELYHHLHARIAELEAERDDMKRRLKLANTYKSKMKTKYENLLKSHGKAVKNKSAKAIELIENSNLTTKEIAKKCYITTGTVYNLRNKLKGDNNGK